MNATAKGTKQPMNETSLLGCTMGTPNLVASVGLPLVQPETGMRQKDSWGRQAQPSGPLTFQPFSV